MKLKQIACFLAILISSYGISQTSTFKFNEYSFSNVGAVPDALGGIGPSGSPDWVEIRNQTKQIQSLTGWYLSDERYNLHKWQVPFFNSQPIVLDTFMTQVVYLCGHDKPVATSAFFDSSGVDLHANFQLNQTKPGAVLYLTKVNANIPSDSIHIKITQPDHSWGRFPNGSGNYITGWKLYPKPSPGRANPNLPAYYKDYLPKPKFDVKPGYYAGLPSNPFNISDSSTLNTSYATYSKIAIYATNNCTKPDTQATASTVQVDANEPLGTALTGPFSITTTTANPAPTGFMVRAIMHDATPTSTVTPKYWDSFETYGAYYDSVYKMNVTCICISAKSGVTRIDTNDLFITKAQDTIITTLFDYFDKTGKEIMRNQGQSMINKIDFFNPNAPKKQWQFLFRAEDEYGYNYTNPYQFFQNSVTGMSKRADFPELIFRSAGEENFLYPGGGGTSLYEAAHIRDFFNHTMSLRHNLNYEAAHYVPTYMLMNGVNKGIYYIKEPLDSGYTNYYFNRPNAAILENGIVSGGTPGAYTTFTVTPVAGFGTTNNAVNSWDNFYNNWAMLPGTNVHIPAIYNELSDSLDFASLNDYTIYNMLSVNADYLNRSALWWKGLPNDTADHRPAKWRFGLANTDLTWGFNPRVYNNSVDPFAAATNTPCDFIIGFTPAKPEYPIMALWNKLMDNDTFKTSFLSRYTDLLNGGLSCDSLTDHLKYVRTLLAASDMASHVWWNLADPTNFPAADSVHYWNAALDSMKVFIMQRCSLATAGIKDCFTLNGPFNLCVDVSPTGTGYVTLNTLTLKNFIWNGKYFDSVTMAAKAIPYQNYVFDHWETTPSNYTLNPNNKSDSINFFVSRDVCLKAIFKLKPAYETTGTPLIPTGFSPNGDNNNDVFNIYGINDANSYELEVYNRWGEIIFHSVDKTQGWDGTFNNVPVPVGVYAYRYNIMMDGKTYKSKGSVTLLR